MATSTDQQIFALQVQIAGLTAILDSYKSSMNTADKIRLAALQHGVDSHLALNIACAESELDPTAKNPNSTAGGVYQFLSSSWRHYSLKYWGTASGHLKMNEDDNIELAMFVLAATGPGDWAASKYEGYGGGWSNKPFDKGLCTSGLA